MIMPSVYYFGRLCFGFVIIFIGCCRLCFQILRKMRRTDKSKTTIGFFHPYCNGGGGGERVLWMIVASILQDSTISKNVSIIIYSGDITMSALDCLQGVKNKFSIDLTANEIAHKISFVPVKARYLLEGSRYKHFTMLMQALGSVIVGLECLIRFTPDVYFDTIGAAFTYPASKLLAGCSVLAYVHYPMISTDMLQKVRDQRPTYNNNKYITGSTTISTVKLLYYQIFAILYSAVGRCADLAIVNGSWTENHIRSLWSSSRWISNVKIVKIFPPCNTEEFSKVDISKPRQEVIVSIGQFRPEKDHALQIKAFIRLCEKLPKSNAKLVLIGGSRNSDDDKIVHTLKELAYSKDVPEHVQNKIEFVVNAPFKIMKKHMEDSSIGLHTMWNEHFGISIVEMMAAGLVVIAHRSGGPLLDIVVPALNNDSSMNERTVGLLAETVEEYAAAMEFILKQKQPNIRAIQLQARESANRFSDEVFCLSIVASIGQYWKNG